MKRLHETITSVIMPPYVKTRRILEIKFGFSNGINLKLDPIALICYIVIAHYKHTQIWSLQKVI